MTEISVSLLAASFANLIGDIQDIPVADYLHVDVMDGHFVPNLTMGAPVLGSLKTVTEIPLDVHLMIERPRILLESFCKALPDRITLHVESDTAPGLEAGLDMIASYGVRRGMAIRPNTKARAVLPYIKQLDMVLVMTVEPGFGGQSFLQEQLDTIREVKSIIDKHNPECVIQVDGGINLVTAPLVKEAGATILVAGSAVFKAEDRNYAIHQLQHV